MIRRGCLALVLLVSVFLLDGQAQQSSSIQRLGITGTTLPPAAWFVVKGSPAQKAGIKTNDQIVAFDGQPVPAGEDLSPTVDSAAPGSTR